MPEDQNDQTRFRAAAILGLVGCLLAFVGAIAVKLQSNSVEKFEVYLIVVLIGDYVINVGSPAFYIVSVPNLKNYVSNYLWQNVLGPLIETLNTMNQFVSSISPSNRVDPMYDINV